MKKQLKQEWKQQETKTKKSKGGRWFLSVLFLLVVTGALLPVYRQQQLTAPQRLLSKGIKQESLGQLSEAEIIYRDVYQNHPQAEEAVEALLRIGRLWHYDFQDEKVALLSYLQLEHDYPDSPLVLPAREEAAKIVKYSLRDYSQAIGYYQRLLDMEAGTPDQYLYEIADSYFRLENYPQARIELETLLDIYPHSPLAPDALYRKAGVSLLESRIDAARQDWQQLIERYPESSYRIQAEFNLAKLLEEEEHLHEALDRYRQIENFPRPALLQEKIEHLEQRIATKKKAL